MFLSAVEIENVSLCPQPFAQIEIYFYFFFLKLLRLVNIVSILIYDIPVRLIYVFNCFIFFQVGPANVMVGYYEKALSGFEESENVMEELVSIRYEKVCRVV